MACAEEFWIADELWRLAHSTSHAQFVLIAARVLGSPGSATRLTLDEIRSRRSLPAAPVSSEEQP